MYTSVCVYIWCKCVCMFFCVCIHLCVCMHTYCTYVWSQSWCPVSFQSFSVSWGKCRTELRTHQFWLVQLARFPQSPLSLLPECKIISAYHTCPAHRDPNPSPYDCTASAFSTELSQNPTVFRSVMKISCFGVSRMIWHTSSCLLSNFSHYISSLETYFMPPMVRNKHFFLPVFILKQGAFYP